MNLFHEEERHVWNRLPNESTQAHGGVLHSPRYRDQRAIDAENADDDLKNPN